MSFVSLVSKRRGCTAALLFCVIGFAVQPAHSQTQARRVVRVIAERFAFTPSEIVVSPGEEIELHLKSDDTMHGFRVAGTTVNIVIPKRGHQEVVTTLRVDTPGRYVFECTRMCGAGHNFMRGVLVVRDSTKKQ